MRRWLILATLATATAVAAACSSFDSAPSDDATDGGEAGSSGDGSSTPPPPGPPPRCDPAAPGSGPPPLVPEGGGPTPCDGGTFELSTSSKNCGTCGRVCASNSCVGGACGATVLATVPAEQLVSAGLLGSEILYHSYASADVTYAMGLDGGDARAIWDGGAVLAASDASARTPVYGIASDGTEAWVLTIVSQKGYAQQLLADGRSGTLLSLDKMPVPNTVAKRGSKLIYVSDDDFGAAAGAIVSFDTSTGQSVLIKASEPYARGLSIAGNVAVWGREPLAVLGSKSGDGAIVRFDLDTTSYAASGPANPSIAVVSDGTYIYFFDDALHAFRRLPIDFAEGATPETIAAWQAEDDRANWMTVAGDYVYAVLAKPPGTGRVIVRVPRCGGEPVIVARDDVYTVIHGKPLVTNGSLFFGSISKILATEP